MVGLGKEPSRAGTKLTDEYGNIRIKDGYNGKDVTLRLPDNITIHDVEYFGVFCYLYKQNFGHVRIPKNIEVPADLKTLESNVIRKLILIIWMFN